MLPVVRTLFKHFRYLQNYQLSTVKRTELGDLKSLTQGYGAGSLHLRSLSPVTPAREPHSTQKRTQGFLNLMFSFHPRKKQKDWTV